MENLEITLSFHDGQPIYEQIEAQIRTQIGQGKLKPGDAIPSMRALARMLQVSVITVQKAYENLRAQGLIESAVGRGTRIAASSANRLQEQQKQEVKDCLGQAISRAKQYGMEKEELIKLVQTGWEEKV